jgi:hypothetical protein
MSDNVNKIAWRNFLRNKLEKLKKTSLFWRKDVDTILSIWEDMYINIIQYKTSLRGTLYMYFLFSQKLK